MQKKKNNMKIAVGKIFSWKTKINFSRRVKELEE